MKTQQHLELKGFLSFLILHELKLKSLCGEDLAVKIGRRKGTDPLTPGTIYPTLKELRKQKFIRYKRFGRKKMYSLTDKGNEQIAVLYDEFSRYFYGLKQHIKRPKKLSKHSKQKAEVKETNNI